MTRPHMTIDLDIPRSAAERIAIEDAARECQCPICGRLHRKLASNPPDAIKGCAALDTAWATINALGGPHGEYDDFGRGINHTVEQALHIIEELGGMDPLKRAGSR